MKTLKERNLAICDGVDGARPNKPVRERKKPCAFTHVWNIRNKRDEHGTGERKTNQDTDS